jgi:hypothetical protein
LRSALNPQMMSCCRFDGHRVKVFHGVDTTSEQFQRLTAYHGIAFSMNRSGNVWDNAAMESYLLAQDRTDSSKELTTR